MNEQNTAEYIDFSKYRDHSLETPWSSLVNQGLPFGKQIIELITKVAKLPDPDIQLPLLASAMLTPSTLSSISPVVWFYGPTGTGKSALGVIASKLHHNLTPLMGTATAASIRNEVNSRKWLDYPDCNYENNFALIWDDISPLLFTPEVFTLLKCGYSRETRFTTIAGQNGVNLRFDTYGPKFISSCSAIWSMPEYVELKRRSLIFNTKPLSEFKTLPADLTLFDYESIDFYGLADKFYGFWRLADNLENYSKVKRSLSKKRSRVNNLQLFKITLDNLTAGILAGIWDSEDQAIDHLIKYSIYLDEYLNLKPPSINLLGSYLAEIEAKSSKEQEQLKDLGLPITPAKVKPSQVKQFLKDQTDLGNLEVNQVTNSYIHDLMTSFGWKLVKSNKESYWQKKEKS